MSKLQIQLKQQTEANERQMADLAATQGKAAEAASLQQENQSLVQQVQEV